MAQPSQLASDDPAGQITAYCAPGLKHYAETLLEARGEQYAQLIEHPYLAGHADVILTTNPTWPAQTS